MNGLNVKDFLAREGDTLGIRTQEELAAKLSKSQSSIANKLRVLKLEDSVKKLLLEHNFTERHARALLKLDSEADKIAAILVIVKEGMSVARAERYIDQLILRRSEEPRAVNLGVFLNNLNQSLARIQRSGIGAISERRETENEIVLTITIPKG